MVLVTIEKVGTKFQFFDNWGKNHSCEVKTDVTISNNAIKFLARKLIDYLKKPKNRRALESKSIPSRNEGNLCNIFRIADLYKVKWWQLMDVTFDMAQVTSLGIKLKYEGPRLELIVYSPKGVILIELEKRKFNNWTASKGLNQINQLVLTHGRPRGIERTKEGAKILARIEKELPFLPWDEKRKIGNKLLEKPKKKREIFLKAYVLRYRNQMSQSASEPESP